MKETRILMGMPVTIEIRDPIARQLALDKVFDYFDYIDKKFSTYKEDSKISAINRGEITAENYSEEMRVVFDLAEKTKIETSGYFNIARPDGKIDPSGIVKGWAIKQAAKILDADGYKDFFIDVGGDIEARRPDSEPPWSIGIRNPFNRDEIVKTVYGRNFGVATSGTAVRGQHIYNPHAPGAPLSEIVSLTVIGPDVCEADRFATAAFAMGLKGVEFIQNIPGLEAYAIDSKGIATMTPGFKKFTIKQ